jgi:hypothetical protein
MSLPLTGFRQIQKRRDNFSGIRFRRKFYGTSTEERTRVILGQDGSVARPWGTYVLADILFFGGLGRD